MRGKGPEQEQCIGNTSSKEIREENGFWVCRWLFRSFVFVRLEEETQVSSHASKWRWWNKWTPDAFTVLYTVLQITSNLNYKLNQHMYYFRSALICFIYRIDLLQLLLGNFCGQCNWRQLNMVCVEYLRLGYSWLVLFCESHESEYLQVFRCWRKWWRYMWYF